MLELPSSWWVDGCCSIFVVPLRSAGVLMVGFVGPVRLEFADMLLLGFVELIMFGFTEDVMLEFR